MRRPSRCCTTSRSFTSITRNAKKAGADALHDGNPDVLVGWYSDPHSGPENPDFTRRLYGWQTWRNNYDASLQYCLFRPSWNDFWYPPEAFLRGLMLVYPQDGRLIDTLEWEGLREGLDDVRYGTLLKTLAERAAKSSDVGTMYAGRAALAKPLAEGRGRFAGPKLLRVDSLLLTIAIGCGDVAEMKRIYAQICETYEALERKNPWLVFDARTRFANEMLKREEWFDLLRRAGRIYFSFDVTETRTDWHKEVIAMSRELLWPEERVEYALTWLEDAPRTAEAAYRAGLFDKLKTENRMALYNCYSLFEKNSEKNLIKSKPAPHLAADAPGREAAVCAAYDAWGLHVYMRFNDPDAGKARDGVAGGFSCEYDFQPGGEAPWHWNMITRADRPNVDQGAVWDSPRPGFKVGAEYIAEDSFSSSDCHVFHVFVPWILCWREFPKDGDVWRMVIAASWSGQFGTMGGGAVHELGRAMRLKFVLPAEARAKMLRKLLRQAVNDYRKVRDKWENASFWSDPDLGDPAFHEAVVRPFVAACDQLAEECASDALTDARAAEIFATKLGDLADFRLALDKRRTDYVRAKLFEVR